MTSAIPTASYALHAAELERRPRRQRSGTLTDLMDWRNSRAGSGVFNGEEGLTAFGVLAASSSGSSNYGSDSAYGTLDEGDSDRERVISWRKRDGLRRTRRRGTRSRSVGDNVCWSSTDSSPEVQDGPMFESMSIDYDIDSSFDSLDSFQSTTAESSTRSSPEPSEFEFDLAMTTAARKERRRLLINRPFDLEETSLPFAGLSRRHTLPRRRSRLRSASISISLVTPSVELVPTSTVFPAASALPTLPPLTMLVASLSLSLSLLSRFAPIPLLPASPVHLIHYGHYRALEYANALFSPFLVGSSSSAVALAAANLFSLKGIEESSFTRRSAATKAANASGMWAAIISLRVLLSWIFGRVLGWAHPEWFATSAIHEVGSGLAPLLLAISVVQAYSAPQSTSLLQIALLAANFCTPIGQGGTGVWLALSGAIVGLASVSALAAFRFVASRASPSTSKRGSDTRRSAQASPFFLAFLLLPILALFSPSLAPALTSSALETSFSALHPQHPNLLTVLLMTAPRPGNPDYLLRTVESWLDALPEPALSSPNASSTDRVRVIVYTHFRTHAMFDLAQSLYTVSPLYARKAAHYMEWHRDSRGADRLDQRLHVARGLEYAAASGGSSAYIMLAEDDFPLCPPGASGQKADTTWEELQRVLLATNEAMPDFPPLSASPSSAEEEATAGHCGLFIATGGSGLAMRGFIAAKLPTLLLGAQDPHGNDRDERASRGEFSIKHEDEGADTPDLVIQDCLRGRLEECRVCAPPESSSIWRSKVQPYPAGSARNGGGIGLRGDRRGKSGLAGTERLLQHHLGYNASTLPGRKYGKEEWACGWRQPFNGQPDVLTV